MRHKRSCGAVALAGWLALTAGAGAAKRNAGREAAGGLQVVRQIDDPGTGRHWLLERDPAHPGGPGRLLAVSGQVAAAQKAAGTGVAPVSPFRPVIRAGDRLVVSEETNVVSARLEAVAMEPAAAGRKFKVRLKFGGKVLNAVAVAPGQATLAAETGAWR
jgi:hypothetical protein